jgi:hypothetical protein
MHMDGFQGAQFVGEFKGIDHLMFPVTGRQTKPGTCRVSASSSRLLNQP